MKELKQETKLKLSTKQLQSVITSQLQENQGLNDLFSMLVNGLMLSEPRAFLNESQEGKNKGNGYCCASRSGKESLFRAIS